MMDAEIFAVGICEGGGSVGGWIFVYLEVVSSLSGCVLSAACIARCVSVRVLILVASGYVAVIVDCVCMFSFVVCEDVIKV